MSDIRQIKADRLRFLWTVYDLAKGVPSHGVRGDDVAVHLGIDRESEEFRSLAYFHEKDGNTQALEMNGGRFIITAKGIAEVERKAMPASRRERRDRFLAAIYEQGKERSNRLVMLPEIAPELGMDTDDPKDYDELVDMARYCVERGYARKQFAGFEAISITSEGIDEVEGSKPPTASSSTTHNWSIGQANGANFNAGTQGDIDMSGASYDFRSIEEKIDRFAANPADAEEFRAVLDEVRRQMQQDGTIKGGSLAKVNDKMQNAGWFTSPLAGIVMRFLVGV